jgi:ATP-dependent Clp protease ATP-binding subunit ClpC
LLGLLREQDGVAARVLMNLHLNLEDLREEILNLLGAEIPFNEQPDKPYNEDWKL